VSSRRRKSDCETSGPGQTCFVMRLCCRLGVSLHLEVELSEPSCMLGFASPVTMYVASEVVHVGRYDYRVSTVDNKPRGIYPFLVNYYPPFSSSSFPSPNPQHRVSSDTKTMSNSFD